MNSRAAALLAAGVLLAALGPPAPAAAHAAYAASDPVFGARLSAAPQAIELRFTQQLFRRAGANEIRLSRAADGAAIALGAAQIENADRSVMRAELLEPLPTGRYLVSWRNLSADDGDADSGSYPFYVGRGPTAAEEQADRALAAALLITYPVDDGAAPAEEVIEPPAPTVVRRERSADSGPDVGALIWLALGGAAIIGLGGAWFGRWSR